MDSPRRRSTIRCDGHHVISGVVFGLVRRNGFFENLHTRERVGVSQGPLDARVKGHRHERRAGMGEMGEHLHDCRLGRIR